MRRAPRDSEAAQRWRTFLHNHREAIAAVDFFAVPTVTFGLLYCFFIIAHDRRRILHFNVTRHPTSIWTAQQLRDAFPYADVPRFVVLDHDAKYGLEVPATIRAMSISPLRSSIACPWQNGVAEGWVGSCRRELLDHVISAQRATLKATSFAIRVVLSRRPNSFGLAETNAGSKKALRGQRPDSF